MTFARVLPKRFLSVFASPFRSRLILEKFGVMENSATTHTTAATAAAIGSSQAEIAGVTSTTVPATLAGGAAAAVEEDILIENTTLVGHMFGWLWPTSEKMAFDAETVLLNKLQSPYKRRLVKVGNNYINTVEVGSYDTARTDAPARTVVMLHGYGAGLAMYYKNLDSLADEPGVKTYALDWLGMGRSSRPPFPFWPTQPDAVEKTEGFFIDSLEEWRKKQGIGRFILVGHSLGGYLSAAYALKYPENVQHLVLVSPVGLPVRPPEEIPALAKNVPMTYRVVEKLWNSSVSPFMVLRGLGHFGPRLINTYATRRFPHLDPEEVNSIRDYIYHINAKRGSGEFATNTLLYVGAYARKPLIPRLPNLLMPATFLYGKYDWMNVEYARMVAPEMSAGATVHCLPDAGHFLFLENSTLFNRLLLDAVRRSPA